MKRSTVIVWIDDNPGRARTAEDLHAKFINVKNADVAGEIETLLNGPQRPLVILDHVLDKTSSTNPLFTRGSTIAEAIKEKWPSCPVLGVTTDDRVEDIDLRTRQTYDDLFSFTDFRKYYSRVRPIARDFARIAAATMRKSSDVIEFLKPPDEDRVRFEGALPDDLKSSFRDAGTASLLYRWVKQLMSRAGFLYDKLWSATALGLNETGFDKVVDDFDSAKYKGVFYRDNDPRWWTSHLMSSLYKICKPQSGELSWQVGRRLPSIKTQDYSRCYVCNNEFPETVAYLDSASSERRPMHLGCTVLHPRYKRELYFEDVRMLRGN